MVVEQIVVLALFGLFSVSGASVPGKLRDDVVCIPFKYDDGKHTFADKSCLVYDSTLKVNYVKECEAGYTCEDEGSGVYTCVAEEEEKYYHGEACEDDEECFSEKCTDKKCVGAAAGATCDDDLDCANDLYCDLVESTPICKTLFGVGQACLRDSQCAYNSYCSISATATAGVCAAYYNTASGQAVNDCRDEYFDYQCASTYCIEVTAEDDKVTYECSEVYSHDKSRIKCDSDEDCEGSNADKSDTMESECMCGMSQNGQGFCDLLAGDDEAVAYTSLLKEWYATDLENNCNTARRNSLACAKTYWTEESVYALEYYLLKTTLWTQLLDVQMEVRAVFNSDYWEAKETYDSNLPVECDSYECKESSQHFDAITCAYYDEEETTYYLKECASNFACSGSTGQNLTCQAEVVELAYPGEDCDTATDCNTGVCTDDVCVGLAVGAQCASNDQCAPGFYCDASTPKVCSALLTVDSVCVEDWQCDYGHFCKIDVSTEVGKCATYFNTKSGEEVFSCVADGVDHECETGYCVSEYDESTETTTHTCTEVFELNTDENDACEANKDCIGSNSDKTLLIYSECQCGLSKNGNGYCKLLPGDYSYEKYTKYAKKWLDSGKESKCNTTRRFNVECAEAHWGDDEDYLTLAYYQFRSLNWPRIHDLSSCTKDVFLSDYYDLEDDYEDETDDDSAFSLAFAAFLALFALV